MKRVLIIVFLAAFFALAVIQDRQSAISQSLHFQGIDNVVSAQLIPAHAGAGATAFTLNATKAKDREIISKVLGWLNSSKVVGDAKDQLISIGGNPTQLGIEFRSGEVISVEDAIGTSVPEKLANGSTQNHSTDIPNQVTVYQNNKALRIVAPELKAWIENGWQQEESFTFTPEQAVSKVVKEHPEFPATGDKEMYEDIGGIQGHKQPVTLTTKVDKRGQLDYIVTLTKDYNLLVSGKEAIQYWVFSVDPSNVTLIDKQGNVPSIK